MNNESRFSIAWRRGGAFAVLLAALALFAALPACAWPWQKETPPPSRWQDLPLLVVDNETDYRKDVFGLSAAYALVVPIPERAVLLPLVENYRWEGKRIPLAFADPIVLGNPGREGLRDVFAPLETDGQSVAMCLLLAKGHAPGKVAPAPIDYYMQTRPFEGGDYFAHGLWRLPFALWEGVRRDLEAELAGDTLTLAQGWKPHYPELDHQIAATNLLAGNGFSIRKRDDFGDMERWVSLFPYDADTSFAICFTEEGRRTLREELLAEESPEAFRAAEQKARDVRRAAEAKDAAEKAASEREWLEAVRKAAAAAPRLPAGTQAGETRTIKLSSGETMRMVWCPPGSFRMGSPPEEEGRRNDETRHRVTLTHGFWMAETEVTQRQWESVMHDNPTNRRYKGKDKPVEGMSWFSALEFCLKAGSGLQLPTEAQWEYACRAGSEGVYSGTGVLDEMGWFLGNSEVRSFWGESERMPHPVGQKAPNAWGLRDMHGNVREWCADVYGAYPDGPVTDPAGPESGETRATRGGDYGSYAEEHCRCASRYGFFPGECYLGIGLRPVIVVPGDAP